MIEQPVQTERARPATASKPQLDYAGLQTRGARLRAIVWLSMAGAFASRHRKALGTAMVASSVVLIPFLLYHILVPARHHGERADRIKCASNLRQIGQLLQIYSRDHGGVLPPTFAVALKDGDLTPAEFICPTSSDVAARGLCTHVMLQEFTKPGHCSYVYAIGSVSQSSLTPAHVLAYEPPKNHAGDGINVLYGNGRVEWLSKRQSDHLISELQSGHNPPRPATTQRTSGPAAAAGR